MKRPDTTVARPTANPNTEPVPSSADHRPASDVAAVTSPGRGSVLGRPRALTREQVAAILSWHDSRVTLKQLAASLGVSTSTVVHVIQSRGAHYKQVPPEERAASLVAHRAHRRALEAANLM